MTRAQEIGRALVEAALVTVSVAGLVGAAFVIGAEIADGLAWSADARFLATMVTIVFATLVVRWLRRSTRYTALKMEEARLPSIEGFQTQNSASASERKIDGRETPIPKFTAFDRPMSTDEPKGGSALVPTFSDYVRSLKEDGEPPDDRIVEEILTRLRGALMREMRRRGLWQAPPRYLGIVGASWDDGEALEELVAECYISVFVERLGHLRRQMLLRPNIDRLVFLSIRNFLTDTQKRHDPLGYRILEVTRAAVEKCLDEGRLYVLEGDTKTLYDGVLGLTSSGDLESLGGVREKLRDLATSWNDQLLPDLVTAGSRAEVVDCLAQRLGELEDAGIDAFHFRDLLGSITKDVRSRWLRMVNDEEGEFASALRVVRQETSLKGRDLLNRISDCVQDYIDRWDGPRIQDELRQLWLFLLYFASEPLETESQAPSNLDLGKILGISRHRLSGLYKHLASYMEECSRQAESMQYGTSTVVGITGASSSLVTRREGLRQATSMAAVLSSRRIAIRDPDCPQPGDVFLSHATRAWPVEWVIVDLSMDRRLCRVAPLDVHPLAGSDDIVWAERGAVLRGKHAAIVDTDTFALELRGDTAPAVIVEMLRQRSDSFAAEQRSGGWRQRETDKDPEYQAWQRTLDEATAALIAARPVPRNRSVGLVCEMLLGSLVGLLAVARRRGKVAAYQSECSRRGKAQSFGIIGT